MRIVSNGIVAH